MLVSKVQLAKEARPQSQRGHLWAQRGLVLPQEGRYLGCKGPILQPNQVMKVAMWLGIPLLVGFDLARDLVPVYVGLRLGNEGGGPHHIRGHHTWGLGVGLKKLVVLSLKIHQVFN